MVVKFFIDSEKLLDLNLKPAYSSASSQRSCVEVSGEMIFKNRN